MKLRYVVGIDGGGSRSRGILYDLESFTPLKYIEGGSTNYHNVGFSKASRNLEDMVDRLIGGDTGLGLIVVGLAGLDSKYDWNIWRRYLEERYKDYILMHDVQMTLYAATYGMPGIIVISGTGFNVYGWDGSKYWYAGNWGWKVGDEASGYNIGRESLRYVLRYLDGRGLETSLYPAILNYLKISDKDDLIRWIYEAGPDQIASLSSVVCNLYSSDELARKILEDAVKEAVNSIEAVASKLGVDLCIHYSGGMFRCIYYRELFKKTLAEKGYRVGKYVRYPIGGAIIAGLKKLKVRNIDYNMIYRAIEQYIDESIIPLD